MASGIYKPTMKRPSSAETAEQDSGNGSAAPSHGAGSGRNDDGTAQPFVGQRTLYVDRQVARRSRSRSKTKRIRQLKIMIGLLVMGLVLVIMGWILAWAKLQKAEERAVTLDVDLRRMELKMVEAQAAVEKRELEIRSLMEDRIPGLAEIVFNTPLDIKDEYVRNITFAEAGVGENKTLEYHAMLVNTSDQLVQPKVKIFVFNEFGVQVGMVRLEKGHATSAVTLEELEPGETRSYHAQINTEIDDTPVYYKVHIE